MGGPRWWNIVYMGGQRKVYEIDGWAEGVVKYVLHRQVGQGGGVLHIWVG